MDEVEKENISDDDILYCQSEYKAQEDKTQ